MILCDIGNTSYHFLIDGSMCKIAIEDDLSTINPDGEIYYISVNDIAKEKFLKNFPKGIDLQDSINLDTNYGSSLGIDRIVACSGYSDGVIVDFGSAITIDIMQNNKHLGGLILPGLEKLKTLYPQISPKLEFRYIEKINFSTLPNDTNSAISFAINAMIVEPIKTIFYQYKLPLIITGEHGEKFLHYFEHVQYEPKLIFKNMKFIIENRRNNK